MRLGWPCASTDDERVSIRSRPTCPTSSDRKEDTLKRKVAIITDSAADLPSALAEELGVIVVPLHIIMDGKDYRDKIDIQPDRFYERLPYMDPLPTTSSATLEDFFQAFEQGLEQAESLLCLLITKEFSNTFSTAHVARDMMGVDVEIIDTRTAMAGEAVIVLAAAHAAQAGASREETIALVRRLIPQVDTMMTVDTLKYLQRGGRLSAPQAFLGSLLNVKPILRVADGKAYPIARARLRRKAVDYMLRVMEKRVGDRPIIAAILHALIPEETEALRQQVAERFNCRELVVLDDLGPVEGTHTGPGALGVGYCPVPD